MIKMARHSFRAAATACWLALGIAILSHQLAEDSKGPYAAPLEFVGPVYPE